MAEEGQEKTEAPTGKRLDEAKQKGQVPRSKEMGTAVVLMTGIIGLYMVAHQLGAALVSVYTKNFSLTREEIFDPQLMIQALVTSIGSLIFPLVSLFFIIILAAVIGNLVLGGFNVSSEAMMPKFSKLNPMSGLKRMMGVQSLVELLKSIG